jgi:hypothetical protein
MQQSVVVGSSCCGAYEACQRSTWLSMRWLVSHFTAKRELQALTKSVRLANSVAPAVDAAVDPAVGASLVAEVSSGAPASALNRTVSLLSSITCSTVQWCSSSSSSRRWRELVRGVIVVATGERGECMRHSHTETAALSHKNVEQASAY